MSATPDSTLANPEQLIADLQRQLAECKAERDAGLQRETAPPKYYRSSTAPPVTSPRCSMRFWRRRCVCAVQRMATYLGSRVISVMR